jgi:lysyl-tRNA synthetase, class II
MRSVARTTAAAVVSFGIVVAASGWPYVVQPRVAVPGPRPISDALPLDELSRRSTVPFVIFVGVWAVAALLLGLVAYAARAERLTAGLLLAVGVGGWGYLATGVSLLIVRQVPAHQAFHVAAQLEAIWIPAALAGLAGALAGRARRAPRARSPLVLSWLVATVGALGALDAMLPDARQGLVGALEVHGISTALSAALGLVLLLTARGLARANRRAWQIAVLILATLAVLHLQNRFGYGAVATALVALALVARRGDFRCPGDPASHPRVGAHAIAFASAIFAYAFATLWINRVVADQPFTWRFALDETTRALVGATAPGSAHLAGQFGEWFPLSVFLLGICAASTVVYEWIAPWRYRLEQAARERQLTRDIVATWATDTLAPFVLRSDKSYFFDEDEKAFVAYKVVGGVAIVSGDPVGPTDRFPALVGSFIAFAHDRGWRVAILGASERALGLYSTHGLHALYHGDEAVIETAAFSLEGRPIRKVRQSVHRLEREGYRCEIVAPSQLDRATCDELPAVARSWRGTEPERGFVMALDALFQLDDEHALFVIGRGPDGHAAGFLHFAVCRPGSALSLSSMPRLHATPNGFNEWLVCEAVAWARANGFDQVSLNFAPFAALLAPEAVLSPVQRMQRTALLRLKGHFQLDNLLLFNRKFFPRWQRRFVVYERRRDLPRVGIAALAAEAYLPFTGRKT